MITDIANERVLAKLSDEILSQVLMGKVKGDVCEMTVKTDGVSGGLIVSVISDVGNEFLADFRETRFVVKP